MKRGVHDEEFRAASRVDCVSYDTFTCAPISWNSSGGISIASALDPVSAAGEERDNLIRKTLFEKHEA